MNPEQLTSAPTKQDLLNEEIQKLAMKVHLEVQIRRDLDERMTFVPPDLRVGESVFQWQEHPSKIQQGRKSVKYLREWKSLLSRAPWRLSVPVRPFFRQT